MRVPELSSGCEQVEIETSGPPWARREASATSLSSSASSCRACSRRARRFGRSSRQSLCAEGGRETTPKRTAPAVARTRRERLRPHETQVRTSSAVDAKKLDAQRSARSSKARWRSRSATSRLPPPPPSVPPRMVASGALGPAQQGLRAGSCHRQGGRRCVHQTASKRTDGWTTPHTAATGAAPRGKKDDGLGRTAACS